MIAGNRARSDFRKEASFRTSPRGFTLIEVLVVAAVIAVLLALLLPGVGRGREAARRTQCKNNLKQIGLALHNYESSYQAFPLAYSVNPQGNPQHSWRTALLPYVDQAPLYNQLNFSRPWDDPVNATPAQVQLLTYSCPSGIFPQGQTAYLAPVTPNSCLRPTEGRTFRQITDGTDNTLVVVEVAYADAVAWMSPKDAEESLLLGYGPTTKDSHYGGRHALLADGSVRFLSNNISANTLQALITVASGDKVEDF